MDSKQQTISENVTTINGRQLVRREDLGPGYWVSKSDRGLWEYLTIMNADFQYCTCKDFEYRGKICKHMKRVTEID